MNGDALVSGREIPLELRRMPISFFHFGKDCRRPENLNNFAVEFIEIP
jgi:hypothetical protein